MERLIFATTILILFLSSKAWADLMGKPSGALVGNKHAKYSSMHEKMTDCEQRSDNLWRLRKYPIRLKTYNFKNEFYSPFDNLGGSSC